MAENSNSTPPDVSEPGSNVDSAPKPKYLDTKAHPIYKHYLVYKNPKGVGENRAQCTYCSHTFAQSTTRCSAHLAKWEGQGKTGVERCDKAPDEAFEQIRELYEAKGTAKADKRSAEVDAIAAVSSAPWKKGKISDFFNTDAKEAKKQADEAICLFFAGCHAPEQQADHPLFRNMLRAVGAAGSGYVPPGRRYIGGAGLQGCRKRIEDALTPIKDSWKKTGVTVANDMMTDRAGPAVRELLEEWPHIEHVPCATHVMDLMMEDIGKMAWSKKLVDRADEMIRFVRRHHMTRAFLGDTKEHGQRALQALKPAGTRFGTQYIALERLCELQQTLTLLVTGKRWEKWAVGDRKANAEVFNGYVLDLAWWKGAAFFVKLMKVPFMVMRNTDSSAQGMMGRLYDMMLQLIEDVEGVLDADEEQLNRTEKLRISRIVKQRWDKSMACAMHVAGRILNPANQDEEIFGEDIECTKVFKEFIERAAGYFERYRGGVGGSGGRPFDMEEAVMAYLNGTGSFGSRSARLAREEVKAGKKSTVLWWQWHGGDYPELKRLAIRVLSQPVSASSCEQSWAVWESVHTARRNRLGSEKCRDLVFVAHNWNVVHKYHKGPAEGTGVVAGNIPEPPIPDGYIVHEGEVEEEADDMENKVLVDEYVP
ncbi:unnamed protein product [Closterium sp. Naga37s-1]|nr:unnamed protein product [Closterium sp. Naga37s-1]